MSGHEEEYYFSSSPSESDVDYTLNVREDGAPSRAPLRFEERPQPSEERSENPFARFKGRGTWDASDARSKSKPWKHYLRNVQASNSTLTEGDTEVSAPTDTQPTSSQKVKPASATVTNAVRKPRARQVKPTAPRKPRAQAKKRTLDEFMRDELEDAVDHSGKQPRIDEREDATIEAVQDVNEAVQEVNHDPSKKGKATVKPNKPKPTAKPKKVKKPEEAQTPRPASGEAIDSSAPPLHNFKEIFAHMTDCALSQDTELALRSLHSHRLRIGTMCSGTEAPLLVLQEICEYLKANHMIELEIEHMFSAEIEPFIQAYIQRNFAPSKLFRDIRPMVNPKAETAYGALIDVPHDLDMLVAGFSCVDYSNLNSKAKRSHEAGESYDTLAACLAYSNVSRVPVVVLENVKTCPWDDVMKKWDTIGYTATYKKVDTKEYYIPHTRQRGYAICIERSRIVSTFGEEAAKEWANAIVQRWELLMSALKKKASSPFTDFILPIDDIRLLRSSQELIRAFADSTTKDVNWGKCQQRHLTYRKEKELGSLRPVTEWQANGLTKMVDFGNYEWCRAQPERIKDVLDIAYLRNARKGFDHDYKARMIDLSQNCDRFVDSSKFGITSCITPSGQPYLTTRGGPLVGIEALMLQGIPVDRLHLTRETNAQLIHLAGNAMTSTVIGVAILSALIAARPAFTLLPKKHGDSALTSVPSIQEQDEHHLNHTTLEFGSLEPQSVGTIQRSAFRSSRLCICEGPENVTAHGIKTCMDCNHTACERCAGIPRHAYSSPKPQSELLRVTPTDFIDMITKALPMRLEIFGLTKESFEENMVRYPEYTRLQDNEIFIEAVGDALGEELRFHSVQRAEFWTINYQSPKLRMELRVEENQSSWLLYIKANPTLANNHPSRQLSRQPIARMTVSPGNILKGSWQLRIPIHAELCISVMGRGPLVKSWRSRIGLPAFKSEMVWSELEISIDPQDRLDIDLDITGTYKFLPACGTANGSLHQRIEKDKKDRVHLFLDPTLLGHPADDAFIFSKDIRRLVNKEVRQSIASLGRVHGTRKLWQPPCQCVDDGVKDVMEIDDVPNYRPVSQPQKVKCIAREQWVDCQLLLRPSYPGIATSSLPLDDFSPRTTSDFFNNASGPINLPATCSQFQTTILSCRIPLVGDECMGWKVGQWQLVDSVNEQLIFKTLAWLGRRIRSLGGFSNRWRHLSLNSTSVICETCSPKKPDIMWKWNDKISSKDLKLSPYEAPDQAGVYEVALKARPTALTTRVCIDEFNCGRLAVDINLVTLAHRAIGKLKSLASNEVELTWQFDTEFIWESKTYRPIPTLLSNLNDPPTAYEFDGEDENKQRFHLRPEQERSLFWMIRQERRDVEPFIEEERDEACLLSLGWRVEVRAKRQSIHRGGVLADKVGYGKTITSLALIDYQFKKRTDPSIPMYHMEPPKGKIALKGTLILVTSTLVPQWVSQCNLFLGDKYKVLAISSVTRLARIKISDYLEADIIIAPWNVLTHEKYLERFSRFVALPAASTSDGRQFAAWLKRASSIADEHTMELQNTQFPSNFDTVLDARFIARANDEAFHAKIPSRRLKGAAYNAANSNNATTAPEAGDNNRKTKKAKEALGPDFAFKSAGSMNDMVGPIFEMFFFDRIIVDEYTYIKPKLSASITSLQASKKWVLSGTPSLGDFSEVQFMANFIGPNLGEDDISRGHLRLTNFKALMKDRTAAEKFYNFNYVYSPAYHQSRCAVAERFLAQFVRQNVAEVGLIPFEEKLVVVKLPPKEYALYMELQTQLIAQDMKVKRGNRGKFEDTNDRLLKIDSILDSSTSPKEALMKCCFTGVGTANILNCREFAVKQLAHLMSERVYEAERLKQDYYDIQDKHYSAFKANFDGNVYGDTIIKAKISELMKTAERDVRGVHLKYHAEPITELRELANVLHEMTNEFVAEERNVRFFRSVCLLSEWKEGSGLQPLDCGHYIHEPAEACITASCGHTLCKCCFSVTDRSTICGIDDCDAPASSAHIMPFSDLGSDKEERGGELELGQKIVEIVHLVKAGIPAGEQVLLFCQYDDLMEKISSAFNDNGILHFAVSRSLATNSQGARILEKFQEDKSEGRVRVLMLNSTHESAAGHNLTNANHIIFVSPILAASRATYTAFNDQCIGRAHRFGQTKTVYVYRFLALGSIDVDILQERTKKKVVRKGDGWVLKAPEEMTEEEKGVDLGSTLRGHYNGSAAAVVEEDGDEEEEEEGDEGEDADGDGDEGEGEDVGEEE